MVDTYVSATVVKIGEVLQAIVKQSAGYCIKHPDELVTNVCLCSDCINCTKADDCKTWVQIGVVISKSILV